MSSTSEKPQSSTESEVEQLREKVLLLKAELERARRDLKISDQRNKLLSAHNDALSRLVKNKMK